MTEQQKTPETPSPNKENWERETLEKLLFATLKEQRRARSWSIFFKILIFVYLFSTLALVIDWGNFSKESGSNKHTALIELRGIIDSEKEASAERINSALQHAFSDKRTKGVVMRVNSPGGSPVQSSMIFDEIQRLRKKHPEIPLHVVVEDICASGGYFVAAAANNIYVNKASIVGSIGVIMSGFGFTEAMQKLGVERRLLTAGENKGFLDPFSPQDPKQKEYAHKLLENIHQQFISVVKQGRGKRLKENPDIFSGLIWTGEQSIELGLADAYGTVDSVARDVIKAEDIVDYTEKERLSERLARKLGAGMMGSFFDSVVSKVR